MPRKWLLPGTAVIFLVLCAFYLAGGFERLTLALYDISLKSSAQTHRYVPLTIIGATQNFVHRIGHEPDRTDYARLLGILKSGGTRTVVFDIYFPEVQDEVKDSLLAQALASFPSVILPVYTPNAISPSRIGQTGYRVTTLMGSDPYFQQKTRFLGHINAARDADNLVRSVPAFLIHRGLVYPHIAIEAFRRYSGLTPEQVQIHTFNGIFPDKSFVPLDENGCLRVRFLHPRIIASAVYPMEDVLTGKIPVETFKDKTVVIGWNVLGAKNADLIPTPFGMEFGDTVQYQALYTLYSGQYIYPVRRTLVLIISVVFMLLLVSTFSFSVKLASWTFTTLFTGIIAGSFILFSRTGIFIDPVLPALSGFLAFGSFLVVTLNEARSELSRGHELLSVLEGTQREIARVLRAQEIQGMKRRTYMPAFHEPFFERTPEITLQTITSILGIEYGVLFGVEKPTGDVRIFARTKGQMPREMLANLALLLGDRENLVVNRNVPESLRAHGVENMLLLAVLREPMITLYSFFANKKPTALSSTRGFSDSDYQWLVSFSLQTVVALLNTQLNIALRKSQMETIFRLASSIEYRDRETGQHITRVSEYAGEIAANIGLPNFEVELIKSAMPLHDLGKIAIPDSILLKPEALASQEKEVIKQHTIIGAKMLENSDSFILQAAYLIAISHHEKYDGSGYPYGLKGNAIPLYGRIAAIADVFDAFCSKRVYKSARSFNEALEYVSAMSGKDFDPQMVEAFLRDREKIFAIYSEYQEKG